MLNRFMLNRALPLAKVFHVTCYTFLVKQNIRKKVKLLHDMVFNNL